MLLRSRHFLKIPPPPPRLSTGALPFNGVPDVARRLFDGIPQRKTSAIVHSPQKIFEGLGNTPRGQLKNSSSIPPPPFGESRKSCDLSLQEVTAWHAHLAKTPRLHLDPVVATQLVESYCELGASNEALELLEGASLANPLPWNLLISWYNRNCQFDRTLQTFKRLRLSGLEASEFAYGSFLAACSASGNVPFGQQIHCLILKDGCLSDGFARTGLVDMLAKNFHFDDALKLFVEIPAVENVVCWNAVISGAVKNGDYNAALDLFGKMMCSLTLPSGFTLSIVLTACTATEELELGMGIHGLAVKCGVHDDIYVGTGIIDLYMKCGVVADAVKEFAMLPVQNVVSWTSMISGFVQREKPAVALELFTQMRRDAIEINKFTITSVLAGCASPTLVKELSQLHCLIAKTGLLSHCAVGDALIGTYAKAEKWEMAEKVFEEMGTIKEMSSWASLISALSQSPSPTRAFQLLQSIFYEGLRPDDFCVTSILSVVDFLDLGRQIHSYLVKSNLPSVGCVGCALLNMYSRCGNLHDSYDVFNEMIEKDKITWTSMIASFVDHGFVDEAVWLSHQMITDGIIPDQMALSAILSTCSSPSFLIKGKEIHGYILRSSLFYDIALVRALITMYSKCKALKYAVRIFSKMNINDANTWSSLVSGYAQNGYFIEAILLFHQMMANSLSGDYFSLSSAIGASANLLNFAYGKSLHSYVLKAGYHADLLVGSALVTMYSKCGNVEDSRTVFDQIEEPDLVTWTTLIDSYAQHGYGEEAIRTYQRMTEEGITPDSITFVSILSACSRNGLIEEGYFIFDSIRTTYGIEPEFRHYACMVDLLCRSGNLKEAMVFIEKVPVESDAFLLSMLLNACKLHGDVELAKKAAAKVLELGIHNSWTYLSLSNICAELGDWEGVAEIRKVMKVFNSKKEPGWSYV